jgi:hypothetical protein
VNKLALVIKNIDKRVVREFKAEAIRRGLTLSKAFEEAARMWLEFKDKVIVSEQDLNNLVYESMEEELRKNRGKYAVIAKGKLLGIFETIEDVSLALRSANVRNAIVVKIGHDDVLVEGLEWLGGSIELGSA